MSLHCQHTQILIDHERLAEAAAACQRLLGTAGMAKDNYVKALAALSLADLLTRGAGGQLWSLPEVRRLLRAAACSLDLLVSKLTLPPSSERWLRGAIRDVKNICRLASAAAPGMDQVPALQGGFDVRHSQVDTTSCAFCGKEALSLRKCAHCRTTPYCSKTCQLLR
ncbi:hypothetical protein ABPG75_013796 [Micractinium tetrahymenae]